MSVVKIFGNLDAYYFRIFFYAGIKFIATFYSYFITYMYQLPEIGVVIRMIWNMPQSIYKFFSRPVLDFIRCWKLFFVDFNYCSIGPQSSSNLSNAMVYIFFAKLRGSSPDIARPITSSSHVVPAVFT